MFTLNYNNCYFGLIWKVSIVKNKQNIKVVIYIKNRDYLFIKLRLLEYLTHICIGTLKAISVYNV